MIDQNILEKYVDKLYKYKRSSMKSNYATINDVNLKVTESE